MSWVKLPLPSFCLEVFLSCYVHMRGSATCLVTVVSCRCLAWGQHLSTKYATKMSVWDVSLTFLNPWTIISSDSEGGFDSFLALRNAFHIVHIVDIYIIYYNSAYIHIIIDIMYAHTQVRTLVKDMYSVFILNFIFKNVFIWKVYITCQPSELASRQRPCLLQK